MKSVQQQLDEELHRIESNAGFMRNHVRDGKKAVARDELHYLHTSIAQIIELMAQWEKE